MATTRKKATSISKSKATDSNESVAPRNPKKDIRPTETTSGSKESVDTVKPKVTKSFPTRPSIANAKNTLSNPATTSTRTSSRKITDASKLSRNQNIKRSSVPSTSTSGAVKVTRYFPSKNPYMNRLKDIDPKLAENVSKRVTSEKNAKASVERKPPVNLVKKQIVRLKSKDIASTSSSFSEQSSPSSSLLPERPHTATLRKGSIVNNNIAGPDATIVPIKSETPFDESLKPFVCPDFSTKSSSEYEDDFESYESDFESCSSPETNSKKSISSISTSDCSDSPPMKTESKRMPSAGTDDEHKLDSGTYDLYKLKQKQNAPEHIKELVQNEHRIVEDDRDNPNSLLDEGFEDLRSLQTINFSDAKKRCEQKRTREIRKKRGDNILSMIKLDNVNYTIFDLPPVSYDKFIVNYGNDNTVQVAVQTGEDDINEDVQTDELLMESKWTQLPNQFSTFDHEKKNFWQNYKYEIAGVGSECVLGQVIHPNFCQINEKRLDAAANLTLDLIDADIIHISNDISKQKSSLPFCATYIEFKTSGSVFDHSKVTCVCASEDRIKTILSVHVKINDTEDYKSTLCIWNINNFNNPEHLLYSYGAINCALFSPNGSDYVIAGQTDGTISVWSLKEKSRLYDISNQMPCFITNIASSHQSAVKSIQRDNEIIQETTLSGVTTSKEIYSLDEQGCVIIWFFSNTKIDKWNNNLLLNKSNTINLSELCSDSDTCYTDLLVIKKNIYVSTNYGYVLHYSLNSSGNNLRKFIPATVSPIVCLESCPFSSSYFIAASSNGNLTLYSTISGKSLIVLRNTMSTLTDRSPQLIRWSNCQPFVIYSNDHDLLYIWNLSASDIYPEYSVRLTETVSCFKLSPLINGQRSKLSYMLIGTNDGKLFLHLLHEDYVEKCIEQYEKNIQTFKNYLYRF